MIKQDAVPLTFSRKMPNFMLSSIFATAANSEPLTADRGLKFPVDFENVIRNVPIRVDCNNNVKNVHIQQ